MGLPQDIPQLADAAGADWMDFGPPVEGGSTPIQVAAHFGHFAAEYAAMRQRVGVLHLPQRGLLRLAGGDVKGFLHRLLTRDIASMEGGQTRRAFQLNAKGRIVADLVVHHGDAETWLEMDRFDLAAMRELLERRLFSEDVTIQDISDEREVLWLLGPASMAVLDAVASEPGSVSPLPVDTHHVVRVAGARVTAWRHGPLGEPRGPEQRDSGAGPPGVRLYVPRDSAGEVYRRLLEAAGFRGGEEIDADAAQRRRGSLRGRPVGWLAFNTLRIECGLPLFHIDFSTDSLSAEAGDAVLHDRIDFDKGCYLGQEIALRMKNFGHPRRVVVGLRFPDAATGPDAPMPVGGSQVFTSTDAGSTPTIQVGAVTSATLSPLLGQAPIALAVVKWSHHAVDTELFVPMEGVMTRGVVTPLDELLR